MRAERLLPDSAEVQAALGPQVRIEPTTNQGSALAVGDVIKVAALDYAYRHYAGYLQIEGARRPVSVTAMALVFDSATKAGRTFSQVAQAAHMRTHVEDANVAVETVPARGGLVSYWSFVHRDEAIIILALDTLDPQHLSVTELRMLVASSVKRLGKVSSS